MRRAEKRDVFDQKRRPRNRPSNMEDKSKSEHTFEAKVASTFDTMRENLQGSARETNAYADKILGLLDQLEDLHLHKRARFQIMKEHSNMNKEKFDSLFSNYSSLLNELAPWRVQVIQTGEDASQVQSARMQRSRKEVMVSAKRRLDDGREKQQLATDATEFMKHYKALIMAA